jgi:hypothetical protein
VEKYDQQRQEKRNDAAGDGVLLIRLRRRREAIGVYCLMLVIAMAFFDCMNMKVNVSKCREKCITLL